jgi:hypothetical protein
MEVDYLRVIALRQHPEGELTKVGHITRHDECFKDGRFGRPPSETTTGPVCRRLVE